MKDIENRVLPEKIALFPKADNLEMLLKGILVKRRVRYEHDTLFGVDYTINDTLKRYKQIYHVLMLICKQLHQLFAFSKT